MAEKKDIDKLGEEAYKLGFEYEHTYRGCGQCLVAAVQDVLELKNDEIFKSLTGYAGGGAVAGDSGCGAYVGGILIISSLWGRERDNFADPQRIRWRCYNIAKKLHDKFIAEYGTVICRDIQSKIMGRPFYLLDPDDMIKFDKEGGHEKVCPDVLGKAARWVVEVILEETWSPRE
ncbi:C-GCAxxG-C-C family protein [Chloroflexota bacterium]